MRLGRIVTWLIILSVFTAIVMIGLLSFGPFWIAAAEQWVMTAVVAFLVLLPIAACAATFDRGRIRSWMVAGIITSIISYGCWLRLIWGGRMLPDDITIRWVNFGVFFGAIAGTLALVAMIQRKRTVSIWHRAVQVLTIAFAATLGLIIVFGVLAFPHGSSFNDEDTHLRFCLRWGVVFAVLTGLGLIAHMVLSQWRQFAADADEDEPAERLSFYAVCPRCEVRQSLLTGGAQCNRCGLSIKVSPT